MLGLRSKMVHITLAEGETRNSAKYGGTYRGNYGCSISDVRSPVL